VPFTSIIYTPDLLDVESEIKIAFMSTVMKSAGLPLDKTLLKSVTMYVIFIDGEPQIVVTLNDCTENY
jgi:hypothetical protein